MVIDTAVVGLGVVSETHLRGVEANPLTRLAAVCDLDAGRARATASEYGVPHYTDVAELVQSEALDWVHVCTPVQTHVDLARPFIEAGVPVLIEKPIAETSAEVDELRRLSEDNGVAVTSVQNHVFDPAMRRLRRAVDAGDVGRVVGVDTIYVGETLPDESNRGSWVFDLPGGEFEEGLPHPLYLTLSAGGWPSSATDVDARTALARAYDIDVAYDGAQIQYRSSDGALCSATMLAGTTPLRQVHVHGTDGSLLADLVSQTTIPVTRDYTASSLARVQYNLDRALRRVMSTVENGVAVARNRLNGDWDSMTAVNSHFAQFDAEARALASGSEMPIPLEQSRWTIALMEALRGASSMEALQDVS